MEFVHSIATVPPLIAAAEPWLAAANYDVMHWLFEIIPHSYQHDSLFEFLVLNPLVSTWLFGATYFWYWRIEDERTGERRVSLTAGFIAFAVAVTISLVMRPWISWPAPNCVSYFQSLYPTYFRGLGSANSFPSHATLLYFTVALSVWPFCRRVSLLLILLVAFAVSLPRIYVGGHYPVDIIGGAVLSACCYAAIRWFLRSRSSSLMRWLTLPRSTTSVWDLASVRDLVLFLWLFELAEGFQASQGALSTILRVSRQLTLRG